MTPEPVESSGFGARPTGAGNETGNGLPLPRIEPSQLLLERFDFALDAAAQQPVIRLGEQGTVTADQAEQPIRLLRTMGLEHERSFRRTTEVSGADEAHKEKVCDVNLTNHGNWLL